MSNTRAPRSHGPSHSAPYGKACMHCFKAKSRCVARPEGDGRERCHRLRKTCHPSDPIRKRTVHKNQNSAERVAQLEGKLDTLVTLLNSVAKASSTSGAESEAANENDTAEEGIDLTEQEAATHQEEQNHPIPPLQQLQQQPRVPYLENSPFAGAAGLTSDTITAAGSLDSSSNSDSVAPLGEVSDEEAEASLKLFRLRLLPLCPFIYFHQHITATALRQHRPFLLRCIIAVTQPSTHQRLLHGKCIKSLLAQDVLVDNRSTIDLLLGILVYVTWSNDSMITRSGTLSRLAMLALSIMSDLWLNKPLPPDEHMIVSYLSDFHKCHLEEVENDIQHVWEQRRAILGCFLVTSFVSVYFAQIDSMRWTPHMEECLKAISGNKDCQSDQTLAFQVRLQLIMLKAMQIRDESQWDSPGSTAPIPRLSVHVAKVLQAQVQDLRASLPAEPDAFLLAHTYYVDLSINEAVYSAKLTAPINPNDSETSSVMPTSVSTDRVDCYWRSVNAVKFFLDAVASSPSITYIGFTFPLWAQLSRSIVTLYRLSVFEDPNWDSEAVRRTVNLLNMVDIFADKMEVAATDISQRASDSTIAQISRMMRKFRSAAASKLFPEQKAGQEGEQGTKEPDPWDYELIMGQPNDIYGADRWLNNLFVRF